MNYKFWFVAAILVISIAFKGHDAADQKKKNSSITIVGSVFCDTCFQRKFSTRSYFLPGVWVSIKCYTGAGGRTTTLGRNGQTDRHGIFRIELPFSFDSEKEVQTCNARLIRTSSASCNVPSIRTKSHFAIKSKMNNNYVYSAGPLSYRPARFPASCHKDQRSRRRETEWRPSTAQSQKSNFSDSSDFEFPPIPAFPFPPLPPIIIPLPPVLPPFWNIPPIPFWPPLPSPAFPPPPPSPPPPNPSGGLPPLFPLLAPPPPPPLLLPPPPNPLVPLPPPPPNPIGGLPPLVPLPPPPNPIGGLPPLVPLPPPPPPPNPIGGLPPLLPLSPPPPPPNHIGGLPPLLPLSPPPSTPIGVLPSPLLPLSPPPPPLP